MLRTTHLEITPEPSIGQIANQMMIKQGRILWLHMPQYTALTDIMDNLQRHSQSHSSLFSVGGPKQHTCSENAPD